MRTRLANGLPAIVIFLLLSGCWDKTELPEHGYVQAVALDLSKEGKVEVTTHFFKPTGGSTEAAGSSAQGKKGLSIRTEADTLFEAVRDIPLHFGRKAKWDHIRVIIIGENMVRQQNIRETLDFFSRDHEPRGTVLILIAKGKAGSYLNIPPFIENTIGQQLREIEEYGAKYSAKTSNIPLLNLSIQLKSETGIAMVPYLQKGGAKKSVTAAGLALLKNGKLYGSILSPENTESLIMLLDHYKKGIVEFNCTNAIGGAANKRESFEIQTLHTVLTPVIRDRSISVGVRIHIQGTVGEMRCSVLKNRADERKYEDKVIEEVAGDIDKVLKLLQTEKVDALGIGDRIYRSHPALWKKLKTGWDEHFANIRFHVSVTVDVLNTGLNTGQPYGKKES
ncbi:Ger(x)C family spore germination protein [Paenibacillus sp. WQ 127069]|uniref:Ger(X)C family spore germination protein n=1 Tax=Paenibacillus baimaensis TaxID=2982185 RepID=A0ABT2UHF0_9BACL|nr:Ger(x)C family spore germination protein [Paenibacillus sp. WQ 127069]MCU6793317.1 Ger(x)C family spore germination protein [Paenibacillus sp. WQ 127069]